MLVRTPRGIRSIATYTQEELDKKGFKYEVSGVVELSSISITVDFALSENDSVYKTGALQGMIKDLSNYSITSPCVLTITDTFYGGEEIYIIPWK